MADRTLAQIVTDLDTATKARTAAKEALKASNVKVTALAKEIVNYGKAPRKPRADKK